MAAIIFTSLSPEYEKDGYGHVKHTNASAVERHEAIVGPQNKIIVSTGAFGANTEGIYEALGRFYAPKKTATAFTIFQPVYLDVASEEITDLPNMTAGAVVADPGNTGNGTITAVTTGSSAKVGNYVITCISTGPGVATTGTSSAAAHNVGTSTITATPATGVNAKVGTYVIQCIAELANSGIYSVVDPDGEFVGNATVGSAFSTGSHITFTITDAGATDSTLGDTYFVEVAAANSGTFKVVTPDGITLGNAIVGTAFTSGQINLTINDGTNNFAVDDFFTIPVTQGNYYCGICYETAASADTTIHISLNEVI